uniref:Uncharacterized protein n=1 Tax=Rhizophora mucronata TaxID=61149 RepID=A0A2P2N685_RHIMU
MSRLSYSSILIVRLA